jgi:hypothetical protein
VLKGDFQNLRRDWLAEITKIETQAIDDEGVANTQLRFNMDRRHVEMFMTESEFDGVSMELDLLQSKLTVALEGARSRFKLRHRGILVGFLEGYSKESRERDNVQSSLRARNL